MERRIEMERRWKEDAKCKDARCSKTHKKDLTL
jgi:hypothetical protein